MDARSELENLNDLLFKHSQPLNRDDSLLHQLAAETTGVGTYSLQLPSSEKIKIFLIPSLVEVNYIPITQKILIQRTISGTISWEEYIGDYAELKSACKKANLFMEESSLRPLARAIQSEEWNNLKIYEEKTNNDYLIIRDEIGESVLLATLKYNISNLPVAIFDLGTGGGDSLHAAVQKLKNKFNLTKIIGIDLQEANVTFCKQKYSDQPYDFIQLDINDLEKIADKIPPNTFISFIASGSVTRKVLDTTLQALRVAQQAYRLPTHVFVNGGITESLLSSKILRRVGWDVSHTLSKEKELQFKGTQTLVKPQTPFIPKIKAGHLNLAYHGNPLQIIEKLEKANDVTSIDLGLAYIKPEELSSLLKLLPNLKHIFISGHEDFKQHLNTLAQEKNINVVINSSNYINVVHNESMNTDHLEIQKFSTKFLTKFSLMKTFDNRIEHLKQKISSLSEKYATQNLRDLSQKGDAAAMFLLAQELEKKSDATALEESLKLWKNLYAKCYPVLHDIDRVERSLRNKNRMCL